MIKKTDMPIRDQNWHLVVDTKTLQTTDTHYGVLPHRVNFDGLLYAAILTLVQNYGTNADIETLSSHNFHPPRGIKMLAWKEYLQGLHFHCGTRGHNNFLLKRFDSNVIAYNSRIARNSKPVGIAFHLGQLQGEGRVAVLTSCQATINIAAQAGGVSMYPNCYLYGTKLERNYRERMGGYPENHHHDLSGHVSHIFHEIELGMQA